MKTTSRNEGFSLVEVIIVIGILTILLTIATPSFIGFARNSELRTDVRKIQGDLFSAKQNAITENKSRRLTFQKNTNTYTIEQCNNNSNPCTLYDSSVTRTTKNNVTDLTNNVIIFLPRGTPPINLCNEPCTITLTNSKSSQGTVYISSIGRLSVSFIMVN